MTAALIAASVTVILLLLYIAVWIFTYAPRAAISSEMKYTTNGTTGQHPFEDKDMTLSVIVPCYNETGRLGVMLKEATDYLSTNEWCPNDLDYAIVNPKYEIIIVDDESKDGTAEYALKLADELKLKPHLVKVVRLAKNRGKGGAVTHGIQLATGKYRIFADADGATRFSDISKLLNEIQKFENEDTPAVAIGSRAHMVNTDAVVKRSMIRNFLMRGLHLLVFIFGIRDIKDTQCGFKLFNEKAVECIFPNMHTEGWIFDVELLILAERAGIKVFEIPVNWHEVDGSKMDLARDSINMAKDLVITRMAYLLGIYKEQNTIKGKIE
ncbi:dolichyl-phosphate beta-glucosyltransferase [Martiniozyma asiatica (nom. inval.)]|nr:dolichyl-phosphate beta-glucosyltransferase [Martiniozyma asiatica]